MKFAREKHKNQKRKDGVTPFYDHLEGVVNRLKNDYNIKIGCTTGFTRIMVDVLLSASKKQGLYLDATVAGDDVINGARPGPSMVHKNMDLLNVSPVESVVKVDDTVGGIGEGINAGCWAVGVSRYSNYMNINSEKEENNLTLHELNERNEYSKQ